MGGRAHVGQHGPRRSLALDGPVVLGQEILLPEGQVRVIVGGLTDGGLGGLLLLILLAFPALVFVLSRLEGILLERPPE